MAKPTKAGPETAPPPKKANNYRYYEELAQSNPAQFIQEREEFYRTLRLRGPLERSVKLKREAVDAEGNSASFSLSSETPVERWFGFEILGHKPEEIDMSRMDGSAPYLMDHDMYDQRGVVDEFAVADGRSQVKVRYSENQPGQDLKRDQAAGIRVNVSVGYDVLEWKEVTPPDADRDAPRTFRAVRWMPLEASSVALGADPSVGFGRGLQPQLNPNERNQTMTPEDIAALQAENQRLKGQVATLEPAGTTAKGVEIERKRVADIRAAADLPNFESIASVRDLANKAIKEGMDAGEFHLRALEAIGKAQQVVPSSDARELRLGMPEKDMQKYSIRKALAESLSGKLTGIEGEAHVEMTKRGMEFKNGGIGLPFEAFVSQKRALTTGSFAAGGALVKTEPMEFVDLLRNKAKLLGMGAQMLNGLKGDIYLPRQTGASTIYWIADGNNTTLSDQTFGNIQLRPNTGSAGTEFSRQLLIQSDPSIDGLISRDLLTVITLGMDSAGLNGTGVNGQPLGILNTTGIGSQSMSSADWAKVVAHETKVAQANADEGTMGWLATPAIRGSLKTRTQVSGGTTPPFIWDGKEMNGYRADVTNQMPTATDLFGDFSQCIIGQWGPGIEVKLVEFPVNYRSGNMELLAFLSMDVAVRQVGAFCAGTSFS